MKSGNHYNTAAKPGTVSVPVPGNGQVSGMKGGSTHTASPGKAVTGFTTAVKNPFVK